MFPKGPLFSFDVHDDIRLVNDATVEKDEVRMYLWLEDKLKLIQLWQKCTIYTVCILSWFTFCLTRNRARFDFIDENV